MKPEFLITHDKLRNREIPIYSDRTSDQATSAMNKMRETHLLVESKIHEDGEGLVITCLWVDMKLTGTDGMLLGFKVI